MSMHFGKAAGRRLALAEVPRESGAADRLLDNSRQMLRLDLIDDMPRNPRTAMDAAALRELAESIAEHGLLQAPVVRRNPDDPDRYLTVLGARRIAAHRLLGREEIEVIVRRLDDRHAFLASCVENVQRVQLTAREELDLIGVLVDELGSQDAAARALGKSKSWLSKRKRLLERPALAAAVERGDLSIDHAYDVLTRSRDEGEAIEHLERVRAGVQTQTRTRTMAPVRPRAGGPGGDAPLPAVSGRNWPAPPDPSAGDPPPAMAHPSAVAFPGAGTEAPSAVRGREEGQVDPTIAPQAASAATPIPRDAPAPPILTRDPVDAPTPARAEDGDLIALADLRVMRLATNPGARVPRAALLQALRTDLAWLERA